nr:Squalene epoxidase 1 [Ipomoea batatas]
MKRCRYHLVFLATDNERDGNQRMKHRRVVEKGGDEAVVVTSLAAEQERGVKMVSVNRRCVSNRDVVAMVANSIVRCRREVSVFQHETSFDLRMNDTFPLDIVVLRNLLRSLRHLNDASALCTYLESFYTLLSLFWFHISMMA